MNRSDSDVEKKKANKTKQKIEGHLLWIARAHFHFFRIIIHIFIQQSSIILGRRTAIATGTWWTCHGFLNGCFGYIMHLNPIVPKPLIIMGRIKTNGCTHTNKEYQSCSHLDLQLSREFSIANHQVNDDDQNQNKEWNANAKQIFWWNASRF